MNTPNTISVAQEKSRNRVSSSQVIILIVVIVLAASQLMQVHRATATGPDTTQVKAMVENKQTQAAMDILIQAASERGGWEPAPDNTVIYDPALPRNVRAEVMVRDLPPSECTVPRLARITEECGLDLVSQQDLVRFGHSTFVNPQPDGTALPRPTFDDLLSTYIEELSHSWQEYLFETEGLGSGPRVRHTSWEDASYWSHGWEYQAKRYVLSLDGSLLFLSDAEREALKGSICKDNGYANPMGYAVPSHGAPTGWPHPEGWPVTAPTPDELAAFCAGA